MGYVIQREIGEGLFAHEVHCPFLVNIKPFTIAIIYYAFEPVLVNIEAEDAFAGRDVQISFPHLQVMDDSPRPIPIGRRRLVRKIMIKQTC